MQQEDVEKKVRQRPFKPFRLYLTDGSTYEVRHPELIMLGRRYLVLGIAADPSQTVFDQSVDIDLFHIVRMDYVETPAAANGQ
ncbi:MAG TPA: hypothetical protein VN688_01605 [Gemmataceae bacterium]|nr:hypothetical protein [Gemmataceae bacterium]